MKRGEKMSAKQRAAHGRRIKAAWRKRKTNGNGVSAEINNTQSAVRNLIRKLVQAQVQAQIRAEVKRQIAEIE